MLKNQLTQYLFAYNNTFIEDDCQFINNPQYNSLGLVHHINEITDIKLLQKLANDNNIYIREQVAKNSNTPINILINLINDQARTIKSYAIYSISTNDIQPNILQKLANTNNRLVKQAIAKNSNTSSNTLQKLSQDQDYQVKLAVVENNKTFPYILQKLVNDQNDQISNDALNVLTRRKIKNKHKNI